MRSLYPLESALACDCFDKLHVVKVMLWLSLHKDEQLLPWFPSALNHHARNQTTHREGRAPGKALQAHGEEGLNWGQPPAVPNKAPRMRLKLSWTLQPSHQPNSIQCDLSLYHMELNCLAKPWWNFWPTKLWDIRKCLFKSLSIGVVCYERRDNWNNFKEEWGKPILWSRLTNID